ncbi:DUF732 domain-containing protein [Rhodococcus sp. SGAir0479]|uniref:DUF732 domain-containing protein n=1 Tax=Rhodococcus sp. SGAir0479 TaxID=2567884 RepID=UPI0010CD2B45|nr:DUF732 domain-containing protein [Rhodococcus sp. SGAir0479]QCQ91292.1 hypothetical protein E7742_08605 [Rhodococcus sp. SGAir0479]
MPTPSPTFRSAWRAASLGAVGVLGAALVGGCTLGSGIDEAPAGAETAAAAAVPTSTVSTTEARVARYAEALATSGFPDVVPQATLFALGDGVCRQSAAGTPDASILEHLQPTGAYGASRSGGALTAEAATRLLLDAARSSFC